MPWLLGSALAGVCAGREYTRDFEPGPTSWKATLDQTSARIIHHERSTRLAHEGEAAELIEVESKAAVTILQFEHELPPARLIDELTLALWTHSTQDGLTLSLRVVLPRQVDPRTGRTLTVVLDGESYSKPGLWQRLTCDGLPLRLKRMLPQLRLRLQTETGTKHEIDTTGAYVDAAIVSIRMGRGVSKFAFDDLSLGPLVDATSEKKLQQVATTEPVARPAAEFKLDRLFVDGLPYFPRVAPWHGESAEDLARMRLNVVWVPDYQDAPLLAELRAAGLRGMAVPPRPQTADGAPLDLETVHLAPLGPETEAVLFWYLGTRIPPEARRELAQWEDQVRNADRLFQRPIMGDVTGSERAYSRQLSMLGASRAMLGTTFDLKQYRDWLIERRNLAQPGSFVWTWVHSEPPPATVQQRNAAGWSPIVIEPEALRLQVYAALAAGCRGIGYWTQSPFDDAQPGAAERRLMIAQLNMEMELLEPWLATGTPANQTSFAVQFPATRNTNALGTPNGPAVNPRLAREREAQLNDREIQLRRREQAARELEAAVIRTDYGLLVLPVWYARDAQFVPGQMTANQASIVIPGVGEAARVWEVSTTEIHSLDSERVTGGRRVTLRKFDMTAALLFTEDELIVERLRDKMKTLREASAHVCLELARAKLARVTEVDRRLSAYGMGQVDAPRILARAGDLVDRAEAALRIERYHDARSHSADAMQLLRILQHACWSDAVSRMESPVSSPHTLCYQTLPDHWDMIARFGRAREASAKNVLRSGDFEDFDTMVAEGWKHEQSESEGIRAAAELYRRPRNGTYCLRLIAAPATGIDPPAHIPRRPVTVVTPPVTVYKGQLVYIGGWVKVAAATMANLDGALVYDSLGGPATALRWHAPTEWRKFELVREVPETTDLTLTFALSGLGEIRFDDVQIIPLDAATGGEGDTPPPAAGKATARPRPFDFLKRLPGFAPRPGAE